MTVNLSDVGDAIGAIASVVVALGVIGGGLHFAVVRPVRKLIREEVRAVAVPAKATAAQLVTSNGKTTGEYIEETAHTLTEIRDELARHNGHLADLTNRATENRALIDSGRSDHLEHLLRYHADMKPPPT